MLDNADFERFIRAYLIVCFKVLIEVFRNESRRRLVIGCNFSDRGIFARRYVCTVRIKSAIELYDGNFLVVCGYEFVRKTLTDRCENDCFRGFAV